MKRKILESLFVLAVVILFIIPVVSSMSMRSFSSRDNYNIYHHQSDEQQTSWYLQYPYDESSISNGRPPAVINERSALSTGGPMNSSWPMYCHDIHHTGQSPYSTINTTGIEKWRYKFNYSVYSSIAISNDGTIYFGCNDLNFYALYPNGTIKWKYYVGCTIESCPAIDENGVIYVGMSYPWDGLYAFYPNGMLKWRYDTGSIWSSPAIGEDGVIYFGTQDGMNPPTGAINALYPNGTLKWKYQTNHIVYSSPAIGNNGIIYCGSHDTYLYALYSNNGTLQWKFQTGDWIRTSPCIADNGTIYCVSLDNYLYAVYPNGTMKWRTNVGAGTSPTISQDGTIYAGYSNLYAINPINGSVEWTFNPGPGRTIRGATPCNSVDGIIYFGTSDGGEIIAVNFNGSERWRKSIGMCESSPAIAEDGTMYIGTANDNAGYLYAFGPLDSNAPTAPTITGQTNGKIKTTYAYTFTATSPLENKIYYLIDWGDGTTTDWLGPYNSGETITQNHSWAKKGTYVIKARAKDTENLWGPWGTLSVNMPCSYDKPFMNFLERILERFPHMFPILRYILGQYKTFF